MIHLVLLFRQKVVHSGLWGTLGIEAMFLLWVIILLPTTGFELLLAFTYGLPWGFALSLLGMLAPVCVYTSRHA